MSVAILMAALAPYFPNPDPRLADAPWIRDPRIGATRDAAWLVAATVALWLAVVAVIQHLGRVPYARWARLGLLTGVCAGLVVGAFVWWSEQPRAVAPGERGMVVRRHELSRALGPSPVGYIIEGTAFHLAGASGYLLLAPALAWALWGGALGTFAVLGRAIIERPQPNEALQQTGGAKVSRPLADAR